MALSYKIEADGVDVTAGFNDRMVDLTVTDHGGMQADEFKVRLDDRDFRLQPPRKGAVLKVWMDDNRGGGLALMGAFEVKGRKRQFKKREGRTMEIHGKSTDLRKSLKKPRTGAYQNTTYAGIADEIAARHGLTAKVSASIAGLKVDYEPQTEESDMHMASRLARDVDAICKVSNGMLIMRARDDLDMPPLMLRQTDFIDCSVTDDDRAQHSKTTAHHHNRGKARRDPETVENDEAADYPDAPEFMLRHTFPDKDRAQAAAKGKMRALQRQEKKLQGVMTGDTSIMAGLPAIIAWGVELYDGDYVFKTVVHHMTKQGAMTTTVDTDKGKKKKGGKGGK
jgi:uncharacterized protein